MNENVRENKERQYVLCPTEHGIDQESAPQYKISCTTQAIQNRSFSHYVRKPNSKSKH